MISMRHIKFPVRFKTLAGVCSSSVFVLVLSVFSTQISTAADLRSNVASWQAAFDLVPADNPYVMRVQNIFQALKTVVGNKVLLSELYIVDSDNEPWAIALEDGNVVLSRGSLDIIYGDPSESMESKDARMAFVLGHELNHIAKEDFWHEQVYRGFVSRNHAADDEDVDRWHTRRRESELRADEDGFIYASLAGFNTREIFKAVDRENDFLHYWVRQTNTQNGSNNFNASQRVKFLSESLAALDESVKYFEYGTRLAHFGFHEQAILLLDEFYRIFPSYQVLNNLGFVYLQLAQREMPIEISRRFWFPLVLSADSGVPDLSRSFAQHMSDSAKKNLRKAIQFLDEANRINGNDTSTITNLAIAHLYSGDFTLARAVLDKALINKPDNQELQMLMAISVLDDDRLAKDWQLEVRRDLLARASRKDAPVDLIFNTLQLMTSSETADIAAMLEERIFSQFDKLPHVYRKLMCARGGSSDICNSAMAANQSPASSWTPINGTGLQLGSNIDELAVKQVLANWGRPLRLNLPGINATIYEHANGNSVLAIDRVITLITQIRHEFDFRQHLLQTNSSNNARPLREIRYGSDTILANGIEWAAKSQEEQISEIWFANN